MKSARSIQSVIWAKPSKPDFFLALLGLGLLRAQFFLDLGLFCFIFFGPWPVKSPFSYWSMGFLVLISFGPWPFKSPISYWTLGFLALIFLGPWPVKSPLSYWTLGFLALIFFGPWPFWFHFGGTCFMGLALYVSIPSWALAFLGSISFLLVGLFWSPFQFWASAFLRSS